MPGSEAEAAVLVESYLGAQRERAEDAARAADECLTGELTGEQESLARLNTAYLRGFVARGWALK